MCVFSLFRTTQTGEASLDAISSAKFPRSVRFADDADNDRFAVSFSFSCRVSRFAFVLFSNKIYSFLFCFYRMGAWGIFFDGGSATFLILLGVLRRFETGDDELPSIVKSRWNFCSFVSSPQGVWATAHLKIEELFLSFSSIVLLTF